MDFELNEIKEDSNIFGMIQRIMGRIYHANLRDNTVIQNVLLLLQISEIRRHSYFIQRLLYMK
jgi:hypothetical protein